MNPSLIDTDILSEILKQKDAIIVERASEYLKEHQQFAISSIRGCATTPLCEFSLDR